MRIRNRIYHTICFINGSCIDHFFWDIVTVKYCGWSRELISHLIEFLQWRRFWPRLDILECSPDVLSLVLDIWRKINHVVTCLCTEGLVPCPELNAFLEVVNALIRMKIFFVKDSRLLSVSSFLGFRLTSCFLWVFDNHSLKILLLNSISDGL